jgi:uncharacterized membrane protein
MRATEGAGSFRNPGWYSDRPRGPRIRWFVIGITVMIAGLALLLLVLALFPASFGLNGTSYPGRFGPFGGAFFFLFLLILVFFVVRVLFWGSRAARNRERMGSGGPYGPNRPIMVARMRYARGEITKAQYDQIVSDLRRGPGSP